MRRERRPWPAAEGNSSNLRTAIAELLRWTACAANGLLFPASLLLGLAGLLADGVPDEVGIWLLLGLPGSAVNVLAFLRRATPPTGWAVAAVLTGSCFLGVAGWCWVGSFNTWSGFSPPFETLAFGTAGVVTLMALLARWPVRIAAILPTVGSRLLAAGVAAAVAVTAVWYVAVRVERVSAQYPAARHYLRLGGAVRWTDFQVTGVYLKGTPAGDADLAHLRHFPGLRSLYLSETRVTDAGLEHVRRHAGLESLYLDQTAVTDGGLEAIAGLVHLRTLWLNGTRVTDRGLRHLRGLARMGDLYLGKTGVTDEGLPDLYGMTGLSYLHLVETRVSEGGMRRLAAAIPGVRAYNGSVEVTGTGRRKN